MKKRWKLILLSVNFAIMLSLVAVVAVLLPRNTKADDKEVVQIEVTDASVEDNGEDTANEAVKGGAVYLDDGATYTMTGGVIANAKNEYGGAVYIGSGAKFTMEGGKITGCNATYGGAIYVAAGGTFEMTGGTIEGNKAMCAGAIYVEEGATCIIEKISTIVECSISGNCAEVAPAIFDAGNSSIQDGVVKDNYKLDYYEINFYVDNIYMTSMTFDADENDFRFDSEMMPTGYFDYNNSCGWFADEDMTISINNGTKIRDYISADDYEENRYKKPCFNRNKEIDVYTKLADVDLFEFELNVNNIAGYSVRVKEGVTIPADRSEIVIPLTHDNISVCAVSSSESAETGAFYNQDNITNIILPSTLLYIGDYAFYGCASLETVNFPITLTTIGNHSFYNCDALTKILLPDSLNTLGNNAFRYCDNLSEVYVDGTLNNRGLYCFANNTKLTTLEVSSNVKHLGEYWFEHCSNLKNVTLNDGLETIGAKCFKFTGLTNIKFPSTLKIIYDRAFQACLNFVGPLIFPESLESIYEYAFDWRLKFEVVDLPKTLKELKTAAFGCCKTLKRVFIPKEISHVESSIIYDSNGVQIYTDAIVNQPGWRSGWDVDAAGVTYGCSKEMYDEYFGNSNDYGFTYENSAKTIITGYTGSLTEVLIPGGVTTIRAGAFQNNTNIEKIVFAESVRAIEANAFSGLTNLKTIFLNNATNLSIDSSAFSGCTSIETIYKNKETAETSLDVSWGFNDLIPADSNGFAGEWASTASIKDKEFKIVYGNGSEESPYMIKNLDQYKLMVQNFATVLSEKYYDENGTETTAELAVQKDVITGAGTFRLKKYSHYVYGDDDYGWAIYSVTDKQNANFKLINDIDFAPVDENLCGEFVSFTLDGNGFGLLNLNGEVFVDCEGQGSLFDNGFDYTFKNLTLTSNNRIVSLVRSTHGGVNNFTNITIDKNPDELYINLTSKDKNKSMFMKRWYGGTINFTNCINNADYMSTASYFGIFVGGYARYQTEFDANTQVYFTNCVNNGNIISTGMASVFFGNGTRVPYAWELSNCVNTGSIKAKSGSHILATNTGGVNSFFSDDNIENTLLYNSTVDGKLTQEGTVEEFVQNLSATVSGSDLIITNKASDENLPEGTYMLIINPTWSFKPNDSSNNSLNFNITSETEITEQTTWTFEDVLLTFIDKQAYEALGYVYSGEWTNVEGTNYSYGVDATNGYYIFDSDGFWYMPEKYLGLVNYTVIAFDADGNIIDFATGTADFSE